MDSDYHQRIAHGEWITVGERELDDLNAQCHEAVIAQCIHQHSSHHLPHRRKECSWVRASTLWPLLEELSHFVFLNILFIDSATSIYHSFCRHDTEGRRKVRLGYLISQLSPYEVTKIGSISSSKDHIFYWEGSLCFYTVFPFQPQADNSSLMLLVPRQYTVPCWSP